MTIFSQILNKDAEGQKTSSTMVGGISDPVAGPAAVSSPYAPSTLDNGNYIVAYTWENEYGESAISPDTAVVIGALSELVVTLPSLPENATSANIYVGVDSNSKTKQGSATNDPFHLSIPLVSGDTPPTTNSSYEWVTYVDFAHALPAGNNIVGQFKLSDGTNFLLVDTNGNLSAVPVTSAGTELFTSVTPGNVKVVKRSSKEPFSGSANVTHTFTQPMTGFVISNDGGADLTITINSYTFTVKAGEVFDETFDAFTVVTIVTTVAYRAYGRG